MNKEIDVEQARSMTRAQAIEVMKSAEDPRARHTAELLAAGPDITPEDEKRLNDWFPMLPPLAMAVRLGLRRLHA